MSGFYSGRDPSPLGLLGILTVAHIEGLCQLVGTCCREDPTWRGSGVSK